MNIAKMVFLLMVCNRHEMPLRSMNTNEISIAQSLFEDGLIQEHDSEKWPYIATQKGEALVDEWLNTPMPVAVWRVER